jgi:cellulose synthase/poly-beta-1,6-N-acetylglucosamine synthase-like glycosyltransferase
MTAGVYGVYLFLFLGLYFEVFLLITFFEKAPPQKTARRPKRYPSVSIIVPVWNEEKTLAGTIESLLAMEYPKDKLNIIIVNDGSTDNTVAVASQFADNPQVEILSKENGGKYTALNLGVERTQAELVGCLDADSFVMPDSLSEAVKKFEDNPEAYAVVPAMKVWKPRRPLELMQAVEYTFGIFYKKMFDNLAAISVLPGPFSIYRRDVFRIAGPFRHAHQTEDMEMAFRMHHFHLPIVNAHTAIVYTKVPRTLRALLKQRTRWSRGFLENSRDYKYMYFNPGFGYFGMLVLPFSLTMFFGALYMVAYLLSKVALSAIHRIEMSWTSRVPLAHTWHFAWHLDWFYINTSMLSFLILITAGMTLIAILIGRRIAGADFGIGSILAYFALYGFVAPLWLARAAYGAITAKQSTWR